jgi:hypothetical protein
LEVSLELELDPPDPSDAASSSSLDEELEAVEEADADVAFEDTAAVVLAESPVPLLVADGEELSQADRAAKCPVATTSAAILQSSRFTKCLRWTDSVEGRHWRSMRTHQVGHPAVAGGATNYFNVCRRIVRAQPWNLRRGGSDVAFKTTCGLVRYR